MAEDGVARHIGHSQSNDIVLFSRKVDIKWKCFVKCVATANNTGKPIANDAIFLLSPRFKNEFAGCPSLQENPLKNKPD